jgi:hypothetical protein
LGSEKGALAVSHALQCFLQYLRNAVFNVAGEIFRHIVIEIGNSNGFRNVADVVRVPDRHGDCFVLARR